MMSSSEIITQFAIDARDLSCQALAMVVNTTHRVQVRVEGRSGNIYLASCECKWVDSPDWTADRARGQYKITR
jgi:hypothetical protein